MRPLLLITCGLLISGCFATPHPSQLTGTWKHRFKNRWFRFYADGKAVTWMDDGSFTMVIYSLRYDQHALHFHNLDEGWELRESALVVQEEPAGEATFDKLPSDLNPPESS